MKEKTEKFEQLELFQDTKNYITEFESAKEAKKLVQSVYSKFRTSHNFDTLENSKTCYVFNFKVKVTQLSNKPEPSSPKLFMRKYSPVLEVYDSRAIGIPLFSENFIEKTVPKWINEIYVGSLISQELFYELSKQYILLETINDFFGNNFSDNSNFIQFLHQRCKITFDNDIILLINICSRFFLRAKVNPTNPYITSAINKINNLSRKLTSQSNLIVVGEYLNYSFDNDLIKDIDSTSILEDHFKIQEFFQNDFLFLNNMEFLSDKPYTQDWIPNVIFPIQLLKLNKDQERTFDDNEIQESLFVYQKVQNDGLYFRNEFFFPPKYRTKDYFWDTLTISRKLLIHNEFGI